MLLNIQSENRSLLLQQELVECRRPLQATEVGKSLRSDLQQKARLQQKHRDSAKEQEELETSLNQVKQLSLSFGQRIALLFNTKQTSAVCGTLIRILKKALQLVQHPINAP